MLLVLYQVSERTRVVRVSPKRESSQLLGILQHPPMWVCDITCDIAFGQSLSNQRMITPSPSLAPFTKRISEKKKHNASQPKSERVMSDILFGLLPVQCPEPKKIRSPVLYRPMLQLGTGRGLFPRSPYSSK